MFLLLLLINFTLSFGLDESTRAVFTCDYSSPGAVLTLGGAHLPCSSMYTPVLISQGLNATINATSILDSDTIIPIKGFRCFKLVLITRCVQKWFSSNEIDRFTETLEIGRDECLSGSACVGCEISNEYSSEDCHVFTFGQNDVRKTVIFKYAVTVSVDRIGKYYFAGMTSSSGEFVLGGDYKARVFHELYDVVGFQHVEEYYFNKDKMVLISLNHKRLYTWDGNEVTFDNKVWLNFGKNLILKSNLLEHKLLDLDSDAQQAYYDFFLNAQLNVTNWKLDYLDCRLKNLAINMNDSNVFDLGIGEIYSNGSVASYPCKSIAIGDVIGKDGCLLLDLQGEQFSIKSSGEASSLGSVCIKNLRLNRTHVLNLNSNGVVELVVYNYPSLQEEESILNYPPSVVFDKSEIMSLINASSVFDKNQKSSVSVQTTVNGVPDDQKGLLARFLGSLPLTIFYFMTSILAWGYLIYLGVKTYSTQFSINRLEPFNRDDKSNKSFELKI